MYIKHIANTHYLYHWFYCYGCCCYYSHGHLQWTYLLMVLSQSGESLTKKAETLLNKETNIFCAHTLYGC